MGPKTTRGRKGAARLASLASLAMLICAAALPATSNAAPANRIVGGFAVPATTAPYQVAVYDFNASLGAGQLFCGGSLIRPRVVLTAAHCVVSPSPFATTPGNDYILAGAGRFSDRSQGIEIHIASAVVNPAYSELNRRGDAALLILDAPVPSTYATPIKLAGPDERPLWSSGRQATVSGFGAEFEGGTPSDVLKAAGVGILNDVYCRESYPGLIEPSTMFCAGFAQGGTDACQGDSGGPLTVPARGGDGGFVRQVGVVSLGNGCARANAPGIYSRVGADPLQAFIQATVNASPDPGDVIGNGGVCGPLTGKARQKCVCKHKNSKKKRSKCLQKLNGRKHRRGHRGRG